MATVTFSPNTQPVYPHEVIRWRVKLLEQVVPRNIKTQTPVLLGDAGDNGSIIHSIDVHHLGDNVATVVRLWTQQAEEDTDYFLENEVTLPAVSATSNVAAVAPITFTLLSILPSPNTGLHLAPGKSLFCALGTAIAS
ncbi:MAG: hypothetical protein KME40_08535 [Komarekiella atlantica HA4396-MV6]|jgi:hypothetical protein|nr:hypothetical protein [Komarekiella atlantica HA4396-MV6]